MNNELKTQVERILGYDADKLKRETGDFKFTEVSGEINKLITFSKELLDNESYVKSLPQGQADTITQQLTIAADTFEQIDQFKPDGMPDPSGQRASLAQQVFNCYSALYPYIQNLEIEKVKKQGDRSELSALTSQAQTILKEVQKAKREADKALEGVRTAAGQTTTAEFLNVFSEQAKKNKRASIWWFIFLILAGIGLMLILYFISHDIKEAIIAAKTFQEVLTIVVVKLFFLAVAVFLLQVFARNYFANVHLYAINVHRENSLKVFGAFVAVTEDREVKQDIYREIAQTIFHIGETGFLPGKDLAKDGPDFVNIIREIGKS